MTAHSPVKTFNWIRLFPSSDGGIQAGWALLRVAICGAMRNAWRWPCTNGGSAAHAAHFVTQEHASSRKETAVLIMYFMWTKTSGCVPLLLSPSLPLSHFPPSLLSRFESVQARSRFINPEERVRCCNKRRPDGTNERPG